MTIPAEADNRVDATVRNLQHRYPDRDPAEIARWVRAEFLVHESDQVQDFIPLLVTRAVDDRVRRTPPGVVLTAASADPRPVRDQPSPTASAPTAIVVPLDGSSRAATALGPAHDLATAFTAPLVLLRACWSDADEARAELEEVADSHDDIAAEVIVSHGFARSGVRETVVERPGSVVCMATTGRGGARAMMLGGVAEEILQAVPGPVVLVGPDCSPLALTPAADRVMVLCFDGDIAAERAVPAAADWARALGLELHLVTVTHHDGDRVGVHAAAPIRARVHDLVDQLRADGLRARAAFPDDRDPARGITRYAAEQPAALIVTSAHRHGGLAHAVLGSVALRVVRHATVPVLVAGHVP